MKLIINLWTHNTSVSRKQNILQCISQKNSLNMFAYSLQVLKQVITYQVYTETVSSNLVKVKFPPGQVVRKMSSVLIELVFGISCRIHNKLKFAVNFIGCLIFQCKSELYYDFNCPTLFCLLFALSIRIIRNRRLGDSKLHRQQISQSGEGGL